jgi:hypothetical protein
MSPVLLAIAAASVMAAPSPPINPDLFGRGPATDLRFGTARIGMSVGQWRAAPLADGLDAGVKAVCRSGGANTTVCDYETDYGAAAVEQSLPINTKYRARSPTFAFVNDRLVDVDFYTSIDAFNAVVTALEDAYGPATTTIRDVTPKYDGLRLPRVRKVWRLQAGLIELTDPSSRPDEITVRLSAWSGDHSSRPPGGSRPRTAARSSPEPRPIA